MPEVAMPRLSDSMEEGTIVRWLKRDGDDVRRGESIVEIETDKATMEYEADADGALRVLVGEGQAVPVGAPIAHIGDGAPAAGAMPADAPAAPAAAAAAATSEPAVAVASIGGPSHGGGVSPVARRLAAALGVELAGLAGSGPRGRVLKADVRREAERSGATVAGAPAAGPASIAASASASASLAPAAAPAPATAPATAAAPDGARGASERVELSRLQRTVARRMAESKATAPDFWAEVDVDFGAVLALRAQLKESGLPVVPTLNDFVVRGAAVALREHARVNGSYRDGAFELHARVNVGVAVAAADGLVVPVVHDADVRTIGAIAAETRRLAERVRARTITPPELSGATFTVSNLGMTGVDRFGGIVDVPQAAILCVGRVAERPAVVDGAIVPRPLASLTLVSDHRILYGADAGAFLATLRDRIEQPLALLV